MTLLAGLISVIFTVSIALGLSTIGDAAIIDTRAQLAADAAALAAVAESAPGGTGQPVSIARRYAEDNGARLLSCICEPGSSAVQVTVAIGDLTARARAVFDPTLIRPAVPGIDATGSS